MRSRFPISRIFFQITNSTNVIWKKKLKAQKENEIPTLKQILRSNNNKKQTRAYKNGSLVCPYPTFINMRDKYMLKL